MAAVLNFIPRPASALDFKPSKVGGVYHKALSGRKRSLLVKTLHDPTPKKWELRTPKGVKHDAKKIERLATIQKNLKTVARQMPDRLRKHPKRDERQGHQWFQPAFETKARKYFRDKSVTSITLNESSARPRAPQTYAELALELLRVSGAEQNIPPADKAKLLKQLEDRAAGIGTKKEDGDKKKKKKKQQA